MTTRSLIGLSQKGRFDISLSFEMELVGANNITFKSLVVLKPRIVTLITQLFGETSINCYKSDQTGDHILSILQLVII